MGIINDQQMYFVCAGIKIHSWQSYFEQKDLGFHSYVTDFTVFNLDELKQHVQVLPTEWNTTELLEETGNNGIRGRYDINHTTRDKVIMRHFSGNQPWRYQEWENEFGK